MHVTMEIVQPHTQVDRVAVSLLRETHHMHSITIFNLLTNSQGVAISRALQRSPPQIHQLALVSFLLACSQQVLCLLLLIHHHLIHHHHHLQQQQPRPTPQFFYVPCLLPLLLQLLAAGFSDYNVKMGFVSVSSTHVQNQNGGGGWSTPHRARRVLD
jgi:hypothetical protein